MSGVCVCVCFIARDVSAYETIQRFSLFVYPSALPRPPVLPSFLYPSVLSSSSFTSFLPSFTPPFCPLPPVLPSFLPLPLRSVLSLFFPTHRYALVTGFVGLAVAGTSLSKPL